MALLAGAAMPALAAQTPVKINLINTGGVEAGTQAYFGFKTAAKFWEQHLTTSQPTVLTIDVGFKPLGDNILGSTGSAFTSKTIAGVANRIKARQYGTFDALAAANLPTLRAGYFGGDDAVDVYTPGYTGCCDVNGDPYGIDNATRVYDTDNSYNNSAIGLTTANAKALGYVFAPGQVDASITFSSTFAFDFNAKDGIAGNSYDFLAVAIHEIGHALGFVSGVDDYDVLGTGGPCADIDCGFGPKSKDYPANDDWFGETLDLFRYSAAGALDWTTGTSSYFSIDKGATAYQNGLFSTGEYTGDGNQASHWIDNPRAPRIDPNCTNNTAPPIGIMNPTIGACELGAVTALDFAAFDAIGWNTTVDFGNNPGYRVTTAEVSSFVPEPAAWSMMITGFGLIGGMARRRRASVVTA